MEAEKYWLLRRQNKVFVFHGFNGFGMRCENNYFVLFLLSLCGLCFSQYMFAGSPAAQLLNQLIEQQALFSANFSQTLTGSSGELVNQSAGKVEIAQPGRLRWDTVEPFQQTLMVSDDKLYQYDIDLEQLIVEPLASHVGSAPARLLAGESALLNQQFIVEQVNQLPLSSCQSEQTCFRLSPKADSAELLDTLFLRFEEQKLSEIVIRDNLNQLSVFRFFDIDTTTPIALTRFTPDVSDDTDVIIRH